MALGVLCAEWAVMKQVWKFPLRRDEFIDMPAGAELLHVDTQGGTPMLWALVSLDNDAVVRRVSVVGTGWDMPVKPGKYVGTYMDGPFVFHVFDGGEAKP